MARVCDLFYQEKIIKDDIVTQSEASSYWESACTFILDNWDEDIDSLTERQSRWFDKILEDLTEMRIEGKI